MTENEAPEVTLEKARKHWVCAQQFPVDKEDHYKPAHGYAQEFESSSGKDVLEYGCGGGSDAMSYLRRGARVWYADIVHENVDVAEARIAASGFGMDATPLKLEGSATIPMPDESFDIVSSHGVIHHIAEPVPVLREFHRVLRPTGLLFVMLYTEHLERRCERQMADMILSQRITRAQAFGAMTDGSGCPYARSYSILQATELLDGAGFRVVKTSTYNDGDFCCFKAERVS